MSPNTRTAVKTLLLLSGFAAVVFAIDADYKTKIITSATLTIRVKDHQFITIRNFTQDQDVGNGRGVLDAGLPPPSPTPTPTIAPSPTPVFTDLTATKSDNVGNAVIFPNPWTWTIHIANRGATAATFTAGQVILSDDLPNSNVSYGSPQVVNFAGVSITGTISCTVDASDTLSCVVSAASAITINPGGSFDVSIKATPSAAGSFPNPRAGGNCSVDPNNVIAEDDESHNTCSDTVFSDNSAPTPTPTPTPTATPVKAGVLTAALPGEVIKPLVIAGPATLTIDPVSGATLAITYRKSLQPIQSSTSPSPTPSP